MECIIICNSTQAHEGPVVCQDMVEAGGVQTLLEERLVSRRYASQELLGSWSSKKADPIQVCHL